MSGNIGQEGNTSVGGKASIPDYMKYIHKEPSELDVDFFRSVSDKRPDLFHKPLNHPEMKEFMEAARMLKGSDYRLDSMFHHVSRGLSTEITELVESAMRHMVPNCDRAPT